MTGVNKAVASGGEMGAVAEQKFLFLKYQAENLKFAEITLLSLGEQNAYVGNEYIYNAVQDIKLIAITSSKKIGKKKAN